MGRNRMLNRIDVVGTTRTGRPVFSIAGGAGDDGGDGGGGGGEGGADGGGQQGGGGEEPAADDEGYVRVSKEAWDNVRGAADRSKDAERLRRENAVLKAVPNADTDDERVKNLLGSNLDTDTVVAMVEALSVPDGDPAKPPAPEIEEGEREQTRERTGLAAGADPGGQDDPNKVSPHVEALQEFERHVADGGTREDAFAVAIGTVMASEDERAFVAPEFRDGIDDYMRAARG